MYWDVNNRYVGINNTTPAYALDVVGNVHLANLYIRGTTITLDPGYKLGLGNIANVQITGGTNGYIISTDGTGNLTFINPSTISSNFFANTLLLGANVSGQLVSNAVSLTTTSDVTDSIAQLNAILGKLVPQSPPNFPNSTTLTLSTATSGGLMCNFVQTDNSGWGNLSVSGGTSVNATRAATLATNTIQNSGTTPSGGNVQLYLNGNIAGNNSYHLFGASPTSADNGTYGNLVISATEDYHVVVSTVTAGFWNVFSASASATSSIPAGWNRANIVYTGSGTATNTITWYYDNSAPSVPAFTGTNMVLSSNVVSYSSTIPMFTTSAGFTLTGNVRNISGDTYPNSTNLISASSANGAFAAPALVSYATAGVTTPITRSNTALIPFTTTSNIVSGFGNALASQGPSITVNNNYNSTAWAFSPAGTTYILYKTGTGTQIEETSITNSYTGGSAAVRIVNPDAGTAADNPAYTGSESNFNSTTGPLYTTDATNVAAKVLYDQTNYSTGFLPVGPNLSGRSTSQYFTFKWTKSSVGKFNISYTGSIAGLWVAMPGSTIDTTAAPTNGWLNMAAAYAGSGVPGTGTGGNGSTGCSTGGAATLNSSGTYNVTFTPGTVTSVSSIYIRVKLTSGQSLTALSIANPTN
jgi:hypothetical protein